MCLFLLSKMNSIIRGHPCVIYFLSPFLVLTVSVCLLVTLLIIVIVKKIRIRDTHMCTDQLFVREGRPVVHVLRPCRSCAAFTVNLTVPVSMGRTIVPTLCLLAESLCIRAGRFLKCHMYGLFSSWLQHLSLAVPLSPSYGLKLHRSTHRSSYNHAFLQLHTFLPTFSSVWSNLTHPPPLHFS